MKLIYVPVNLDKVEQFIMLSNEKFLVLRFQFSTSINDEHRLF